ncbi:Mast cell tryptase [Trichinella papuae]|uniref:Mast cell tryptase n=1 Tax=Trichinella papuae TaxID=268474 RepID=A0A0V1N4L1_9BILA|nr:Mast cell tryptase [Trichinella papuae]
MAGNTVSAVKSILLIMSMHLLFYRAKLDDENCGLLNPIRNAKGYMTVVYTSFSHRHNKECIGTMLPPTDEHITTVLVPEFCIRPAEINQTRITLVHHYRQRINGYLQHEIDSILLPESHSNFTGRYLYPTLKFGLIELHHPIIVSRISMPVCLPTDENTFDDQSRCFILFLRNSQPPLPTEYISLTLFNTTLCKLEVGEQIIFSDRHICAIADDDKDIDPLEPGNPEIMLEGAPLLCKDNGRFYQLGIYDWTKIFIRQPDMEPILIFSKLKAIHQIIEHFQSDPTLTWPGMINYSN